MNEPKIEGLNSLESLEKDHTTVCFMGAFFSIGIPPGITDIMVASKHDKEMSFFLNAYQPESFSQVEFKAVLYPSA